MGNWRIFEAMGEIKEEYIEHSEGGEGVTAQRRKFGGWAAVAALAACLCMAITWGYRSGTKDAEIDPGDVVVVESTTEAESEPETKEGILEVESSSEISAEAEDETEEVLITENLPMLDIKMQVDGMGYEGLMFYDMSEVEELQERENGGEFDRLPVYWSNAYAPYCLEDEGDGKLNAMIELLQNTAKAMGETIGEIEYDRYVKTVQGEDGHDRTVGVLWKISADSTNGATISVDTTGTIGILWRDKDDGVKLPEDYRLDFYDVPIEMVKKTTEYLTAEYATRLGLKKPQAVANLESYNIYGQRNVEYGAEENAGSTERQRFLNRTFKNISFGGAETLTSIWVYNGYFHLEKVGDYPLISEEEARELLFEGKYITTVPEVVTADSSVSSGALVYRNSIYEEYVIPYYRFYVELTLDELMGSEVEGLKHFGAYYVPAVSPEYISSMSIWDGTFQ